MLRILLTTFLVLPLQRLQIFQQVNNNVVEYLATLSPLLILIPSLTRNNQKCKNDDDCPFIMRCCEVGVNKFCCTPSHFRIENKHNLTHAHPINTHTNHINHFN